MRDGLSRHYYDMLMLDRAGITAPALADPALLEQVVRNKSVMFTDASASYATAILGTLRLTPSDRIRQALASDYAAMADMFMVEPLSLPNCWKGWPASRRASTKPARQTDCCRLHLVQPFASRPARFAKRQVEQAEIFLGKRARYRAGASSRSP